MAETFHGPWRVEFSQPYSTPYALQSLVISGSDGADGRYMLEFHEPLDITVPGELWSMAVEVSGDSATASWQPIKPRTRFEVQPGVGLTIVLEVPFPDDPGGESLVFQLTCTCLDVSINPPQKPYPYNFTYTRE
jgi:hypothetical protein